MDITELAKALFSLVFALIGGLLLPYLRSITTESERRSIRGWISVAVAAAEQLMCDERGAGAEKKSWVKDFLRARGITLKEDELDAMIEAEVAKWNFGIGTN